MCHQCGDGKSVQDVPRNNEREWFLVSCGVLILCYVKSFFCAMRGMYFVLCEGFIMCFVYYCHKWARCASQSLLCSLCICTECNSYVEEHLIKSN